MGFDYWEFRGDSTVIVDGVTTPPPPRTLGETVAAQLRFSYHNRTTSYTDRFLAVRDYERYAGRANYGAAHEGDVWYQERLPGSASVNSNVVEIVPIPEAAGGVFEGFWGLIVAMDEENMLQNNLGLELELVYLGDASDYADRSAVESALATSPV
jgi:hypothetical protein